MGILSQSLHPSQSHLLPHLSFLGTEPSLISLFRLWWSVLISEWHRPKIFLLPTKHLRCKWGTHFHLSFSSVAQLCPTLCNPMDYSTPGFPVHHQLLELTQTHVHWVGDAIQPSHPLLFPSPPVSLFPSIRVFPNESALHIRWQSIGVSASVSVLPMNIQDLFPLQWTGWVSLQSKGLSRVFSNTTVLKHQLFDAQHSL